MASFYVIMRRETSDYIAGNGTTEAASPYNADRYYDQVLALNAMGPNTCVCGPYSEVET